MPEDASGACKKLARQVGREGCKDRKRRNGKKREEKEERKEEGKGGG